MLLAGKVAIITGAGKGIGKVAALKFAAEGAAVVVASRTPKEIEAVAAEIKAKGGKSIAVPTDISAPEQAERMIAQAVAAFGKLDILVNNAAMPGPWKELVDLDFAEWDYVHGINVRGTMACCKYAMRHMVPRKSGSIITVSSTAGRRGLARKTHYCASKAAIMGFTRALALEAGPHNIRVNCIVPGAVMTELLDNLIRRQAKEEGITYEQKYAVYASSAMNRVAESAEVADTMVYLASDKSSGITGQCIDVNCGSWMG